MIFLSQVLKENMNNELLNFVDHINDHKVQIEKSVNSLKILDGIMLPIQLMVLGSGIAMGIHMEQFGPVIAAFGVIMLLALLWSTKTKQYRKNVLDVLLGGLDVESFDYRRYLLGNFNTLNTATDMIRVNSYHSHNGKNSQYSKAKKSVAMMARGYDFNGIAILAVFSVCGAGTNNGKQYLLDIIESDDGVKFSISPNKGNK